MFLCWWWKEPRSLDIGAEWVLKFLPLYQNPSPLLPYQSLVIWPLTAIWSLTVIWPLSVPACPLVSIKLTSQVFAIAMSTSLAPCLSLTVSPPWSLPVGSRCWFRSRWIWHDISFSMSCLWSYTVGGALLLSDKTKAIQSKSCQRFHQWNLSPCDAM